jgi:hypothetical protein
LPKLFAVAPDIRIDLSATTDVVSLAAREADIAVRFARPVGDSLIVRKLPAVELGLFAAKSYLAGRRPADLDLRRERLLGFDSSYGQIVEVAWMKASGLDRSVVVHTSSMRALINAVAAGSGVALPLAHAIPRSSRSRSHDPTAPDLARHHRDLRRRGRSDRPRLDHRHLPRNRETDDLQQQRPAGGSMREREGLSAVIRRSRSSAIIVPVVWYAWWHPRASLRSSSPPGRWRRQQRRHHGR